MDLQLSGRTAFVSGSTKGIGYAIAEGLAREGAAVAINGRTQESVDAAIASLADAVHGATVSGYVADLADARHVDALIDSLGPVDILVNNVGVFEVAAFADLTDEVWQRYFDINVMSGVRLSRALLPGMLNSGWGRVLFISSESGVNVPGDMVHYGTTKAATLALANGLAKLTRGTGVTVNSILGGPTYSHGVADAVEGIARAQGMGVGDLKAAIAGNNRTSLVQRFLEPAEIASLALYLASPLASATNGSAVRADGGVLTAML
ncbi:SDR family oxidoreductase [soil metagenome]